MAGLKKTKWSIISLFLIPGIDFVWDTLTHKNNSTHTIHQGFILDSQLAVQI